MRREEVELYIVRDPDGGVNPLKSSRKALRAGLGRQGARIILDEAMKLLNEGEQIALGDQAAMMDLMKEGYTSPRRDPDTGTLGQHLPPAQMRRSPHYNRRTGKFKDPRRDKDHPDYRMDAGRYANKEMLPPHHYEMPEHQVVGANPVPLDGGTPMPAPVTHGPLPMTPETGIRLDFPQDQGMNVVIPNPVPMQGSSQVPPPPVYGQSMETAAPPPQAQEMSPLGRGLSVADPSVLSPSPQLPIQTETTVRPSPQFYEGQTMAPPPPDYSGQTMAPPPPIETEMVITPSQGFYEGGTPVPPPVDYSGQTIAPVTDKALDDYLDYGGQTLLPDYSGQSMMPPPPDLSGQTMAPLPPLPPQFNMEQNLQPREQGIMENYDRTDPSILETPDLSGQSLIPPLPDLSGQSNAQNLFDQNYMMPPLVMEGQPIPEPPFRMVPEAPPQFNMMENPETAPFNMTEGLDPRMGPPLAGLDGRGGYRPPAPSKPNIMDEAMSKGIPTADYQRGRQRDRMFKEGRDLVRSFGKSQEDLRREAKKKALEKAVGETGVISTLPPETLKRLNDQYEAGRNMGAKAPMGKSKNWGTVGPDGKSGLRKTPGSSAAVGAKTMKQIKDEGKAQTKDSQAKIKKTDTPEEAGKKITEDIIGKMAGVGGAGWEGYIPALLNAARQLENMVAGRDPYDDARAAVARSTQKTLSGTEYTAKLKAAQDVRSRTGKSLSSGSKAAMESGVKSGQLKDERAEKERVAARRLFRSLPTGTEDMGDGERDDNSLLGWMRNKENQKKAKENPLIGAEYGAELAARRSGQAKINAKKKEDEDRKAEKNQKAANRKKEKKAEKERKAKEKKKAKDKETKAIGEIASKKQARFVRNFNAAMKKAEAGETGPVGSDRDKFDSKKAEYSRRKAQIEREYESAYTTQAKKSGEVRKGAIDKVLNPIDKKAARLVQEVQSWVKG